MTDLDEKTFTEPGIIFQIGIAPRRIDILTRIDGVTFKNAYRTKETLSIQGISIPFISKADLITNKQATGRRKDQVDADFLKEQCQKK